MPMPKILLNAYAWLYLMCNICNKKKDEMKNRIVFQKEFYLKSVYFHKFLNLLAQLFIIKLFP